MTTTARDVMQTEVLALNESDSLLEVHQFFVRHDITGAPVVNHDGRLVGVVSIRDLIRSYASLSVDLDHLREGLSEIPVSEVMTRDPICVAPDSPIKEVVALIRKHRIHRVLVASPGTEDRLEIAGIISLFDLVSLLE